MEVLKKKIFDAISGQKFDFEEIAIELFHFQYQNNGIYKEWVDVLGIQPQSIKESLQIPFLPIELFKKHEIRSVNTPISLTFTSSGTTSTVTSKHALSDTNLYRQSYRSGFSAFYGHPNNYVLLALLPSYLERKGSSLIYMIDDLIKLTNDPLSGFYLKATDKMYEAIDKAHQKQKRVLVWGVTYALLDLAEQGRLQLTHHDIVMETGGMKGRRREMIRAEVHNILSEAFTVEEIHSEYGMTELLSQAYSKGQGIFTSPPWMKILIRQDNDPFNYVTHGKSGGVNVIDLSNYESCSFIQTQDLGRLVNDNSFEILGRFDHSELRGCNLLVEN